MKNSKKKNPLEQNIVFSQLGKVPPQCVDLEEKFIGTILSWPNSENTQSLLRIINKPDIFYKESHQLIYEAFSQVKRDNVSFDSDIVVERLKKLQKLEKAGGKYVIDQFVLNNTGEYACMEMHCYIMLEKYYAREIIRICSEASNDAFDDGVDVFDLMQRVIDEIDALDPIKDGQRFIVMKNAVADTFAGLLTDTDKYNRLIKTGNTLLDKYVYPTPNEVVMVAGAKGTGKTRFIIYWIKSMLKHNEDVSVLWYAMEDPFDKLIRCMISREVGLSDTEMIGRNYKVTQEDIAIITKQKERLLKYDIVFHNEKAHIQTIVNDYKHFCKSRKERINILVIDNLMQLKDHFDPKDRYMMGKQTMIDDYISHQIDSIGVKTDPERNKMIILAHHYSKQTDKSKNDKQSTGAPDDDEIRGSGRLQDSPTQILMIHTVDKVRQIMRDYSDYEEMLKALFILILTKNRNEAKATMRFWGDTKLSYFKPIRNEGSK